MIQHPRTLAERAWDKGKVKRPTEFIPNGCGPKAAGSVDFVPDSLLGVGFGDECCNPHDLAYYQGGFLGLFWRKPKADFGLAKCLAKRMLAGSTGAKAAAVPVASVYFLAVALFGWTPFTWRWIERPAPKSLDFEDFNRRARRLSRARQAGSQIGY
jgi:hypothetical protein